MYSMGCNLQFLLRKNLIIEHILHNCRGLIAEMYFEFSLFSPEVPDLARMPQL